MIQIHRYAPIELNILLIHEDGKRSIVAVFLLLERHSGSVVVVVFIVLRGLERFDFACEDVVDSFRLPVDMGPKRNRRRAEISHRSQ